MILYVNKYLKLFSNKLHSEKPLAQPGAWTQDLLWGNSAS